MFRVVLIDDEIMALRGMADCLPWQDMNMEIVGTAREGVSGLELIRRRKPDIVITDIRMPQMDGLDMIRETLAIKPETLFIILSGYSEFQYAKRAIAYGVMGYLEKPIDVDELKKTLAKACDILRQRAGAESSSKQQSQNEMRQLIRRIVTGELVVGADHVAGGESIGDRPIDDGSDSGHGANDDFIGNLAAYGISREMLDTATVAVCRPGGSAVLTERSLFWAEEAIGELLRSPQACVAFRDNGHLVLLLRRSHSVSDEHRFMESFRRSMSVKGCWPLKIGVCRNEKDMPVAQAYRNACDALRFCIFYGGGPVLYYDHGMRDKSIDIWPWKERIGRSIREGREAEVPVLVRGALEDMRAGAMGLDSFIHECVELLYCGMEAMDPLRRTLVKRSLLEKENPLHALWEFTAYEEVRTYLIDMFLKMMNICSEKDSGEYHYKIAKAQEYILKHYKEGITLQQLAEHVDISPAYFSVLFKKTVGVSYSQYLTQVRMEQAKRLLLAGEKVIEISEAVGYCNYRHFSETFKKYVGVTPKEYRNNRNHTENI